MGNLNAGNWYRNFYALLQSDLTKRVLKLKECVPIWA
jgi:hypothetical protein